MPEIEKRLGCPECGGRESLSRGIVGLRGTFPHEVLVTKRECQNKTCRAKFEILSLVATMQPELQAGD